MIRRLVGGTAGVAVLAAGLWFGLPVDAAVDRLGNDYLLVAALAGAALVTALVAVAARAAGGPRRAALPAPESVPSGPPPGRDIDRVLDGGIGPVRRNPDVRARLRALAIRVEMRRRGLSRDAAAAAVDAGEWTDDPVAAAFLADDPGRSRFDVLRGVVGPSRYQRRVRRTGTAIVERARPASLPGERRPGAERTPEDRPRSVEETGDSGGESDRDDGTEDDGPSWQ